MIKKFHSVLYLLICLTAVINPQGNRIALTEEGFVPAWLTAGPFEQPMFGFGTPVDKDVIGEKSINPYPGKSEKNGLSPSGEVKWILQSISGNGFMDFNKSLRWTLPDKGPEKIWYAISGYASAKLYSETEQDAVIKYGSNAFGKIILNNEEIFSTDQSRPANKDEDEIKIHLKKGENSILVKTGNSHRNHGLDFFGTNKWEWGFYFRILGKDGNFLKNISLILPETTDASFNLISTFFFKKESGKLLQRIDLELISPEIRTQTAKINFGNDYSFSLDSVKYGFNRFNLFIPEITSEQIVNAVLSLNSKKIVEEIKLTPAKHYELHVMMLSHTDIGYTHPQPVVKEIHASALDDVVGYCEKYPEFKWTIETLWQLEQFELSRPAPQFKKIIKLIKEGRIAVNPLYANPFTGWIGEEELIRSLDKAKEYKEKYGLEYDAAVYNDIPGQSWALPQVLNNAGVNFLAEGLNELFNDYSFQRSLPKAFIWEGSDGSRVLTYRNEGYGEARSYGLEKKGNLAVQQRLWERLNRLAQHGYDYEIVLLNSAFMDNSSVPVDEYQSMLEWNNEYEYPKFISSTSSVFGKLFEERYGKSLPVIKGDWTSSWDSYAQGEPDKMKEQRWIQHNLLSAEKISALTSVLENEKFNYSGYVGSAYSSLLNFSGHGSGLEYGYGSPEDNLLTMEYRQDYLTDAYLDTKEIIMKGIYRITKPEEAFEGEGVLVFNPLSWTRNAPVEIQFPAQVNQDYEVIDYVTSKTIPSFRKDHKLFFIANDLPSVGYKKFILKPVQVSSEPKAAGLVWASSSIENQFYKISYNKSTGNITGITDKKSGKELIDGRNEFGFNTPLIERSPDSYSRIKYNNPGIRVINENPVRVILQIDRPGELFESTGYTLWNDIDRIDIENVINLEQLENTKTLEQYSVAFPFDINEKEIRIELLGGFLDPEEDIIPGRSTDQFSIRRSTALFNSEQTVSWTSVDARILQLKGDADKEKSIISNMVNNFPIDWNRNEENDGKISFRYSFTNQEGTFHPAFTSRFGWELSTPPLIKRSWYKKEPALKNYLNINNEDIQLLNITYGSGGFLLRLINVSGQNADGLVSSELFQNYNAFSSDYLEQISDEVQIHNNSISVTLKPNEIKTIKLINKINK